MIHRLKLRRACVAGLSPRAEGLFSTVCSPGYLERIFWLFGFAAGGWPSGLSEAPGYRCSLTFKFEFGEPVLSRLPSGRMSGMRWITDSAEGDEENILSNADAE